MELNRDRVLVIVQARMGSNRLPGKVMRELNQKPMIYWQLNRIQQAKMVTTIVVATSINSEDDILAEYISEIGYEVFRGSSDDVLQRFCGVIDLYPSNVCVRLTADCPLVMPEILDKMLESYFKSDYDYYSNTISPSYPDGVDIEIFRPQALVKLSRYNLQPFEREHVTIGLYTRPNVFRVGNHTSEINSSSERWTVDYEEDLDFIRKVYSEFRGRELHFTYEDVLNFLDKHPSIRSKISSERRNEALKGIDIYEKPNEAI